MTALVFTVFTATYNRAHTLHRVYESLRAQTFRDFEWLIVDDGSTDGTRALVGGWQKAANFPIRYIWKENGGKHTAHNVGIVEAAGEFFVNLDSDDEIAPNALERLKAIWDSIPDARRGEFAFVRVLCVDPQGKVIGDRFPADVLDATFADLQYRYKLTGDKWGFALTRVLRDCPFPTLPQRVPHIPEAVVWMRVGKNRLARCANEPLEIVHFEPASLSRPVSSALVAPKIAPAFSLYYGQVLDEEAGYFRFAPLMFMRAATHYVRFSLHQGRSLHTQWSLLRTAHGRLLFLCGIAPGFVVYARDLLYRRRALPSSATGPAQTEPDPSSRIEPVGRHEA